MGETLQILVKGLDCLATEEPLQDTAKKCEDMDSKAISVPRKSKIETNKTLYRALNLENDELRILLIKAGRADQPLDLQMLYWSREHAAKQGYETISYCWGSEYTEIEVGGHRVRVSVSADQALKCFRRDEKDRAVWIDSICLNQTDDVEKSYQVARMHSIYRDATSTLVWLGLDDGTIESAIEIIDALWDEISKATQDFLHFGDILDAAWFEQTASTGTIDFDPLPLVHLFNRAWFSRLWIMQEVALSKSSTIFCGTHEISPIKIHRIGWWLLYKRLHLSAALENEQRAIRTAAYMTAHADTSFSWFLTETKGAMSSRIWRDLLVDQQRYNVSEPRDRVYGMLGMYQHFSGEESLPTLLQPDYSRPLRDVYRDATRYAMASGTIEILERVRRHCSEEHEKRWPSWVPCYHHHTNESTDEVGLARFHEADDGWTQPSKKYPDPDTLTLYGFQVDSDNLQGIQKLSQTVTKGHDCEIDQLLAEVSSITGVNLNTAPAAEVNDVVMTLMAGEDANHRAVTDQDLEDFITLREYNYEHRRYPPDLEDLPVNVPEQAERAARVFRAICNASRRRRFFLTDNGLCGLGPQSMEVGDIAVLFWGAKWPFILRPSTELKEFEIIGPCYIHGIMAGEAAEKFVHSDHEAIPFEIV